MYKEYDNAMYERARELRALGRTMQEIADILKVSKSTVSRWVNGISVPENIRHANRIITDETRRKLSEAAKRGNKIRVYKKKPTVEMTSHAWIRDRIFKERGRECEECGWAEPKPHTGIIPVQINHKDGNRDNNDPSNLEVLCPNCHSMTKYFMFYGRSHEESYGKKGTKRYR